MTTTTQSDHANARRYRFPPLIRTGLFGSMPTSQVIVLVVGAALSFGGMVLRLFPWALLPLLVAAVIGFKRVDGWPLHELLPLRASWILRRRRRRHLWFRSVPLLTPGERARCELPPAMESLELLDVDASWVVVPGRLSGIAAVHDRANGLLTGVLRATGDGQFSLAGAAEQDSRVALWGDALAAFCRERATVNRIVWQEWSSTGAIDADIAPGDGAVGVAAQDYEDLLLRAAPRSVVHETLLSISIDMGALPHRRGHLDAVSHGLQLLVEELRLLTVRLEGAGLLVDPPLSPADLTAAVRRRSAPFAESAADALHRTLSAGLGVSTVDLAPMAVAEEWDHVRVDGAVHRSWWVEGWPRLEVPAAWMDLLLLGGFCTRTVTVIFEPIAPSQAARAVDEAAVALESAEASKSKRGFRVRATDRRAREEVERRENELVAGFGDLSYCGLVCVAARSLDEMDDASADFEQSAGHAGVQLRALEGRHGRGWVASLPLGRSVVGTVRR